MNAYTVGFVRYGVIAAGIIWWAGAHPSAHATPLLVAGGEQALVLKQAPPVFEDGCLVVDEVVDLDVPEVLVSGTFTVNGAVPLWLEAHTGRIELVSETLGTVLLGELHDGGYERRLIPGVYDVVYRHISGALAPKNAATIVARGVVIDGPRTLDIDIAAAIVSGNITLGGGPPPASIYERGELRLRDRSTGASFVIGVSNAGTYTALVMPGTYDLVWKRLLGGTLVPKNNEAVIGALTVSGPTTADIDVPVVHRTGSFALNGASPPNSIYENAQLSLRDPKTGDTFPLGQTRDQTFSVKVVPGLYEVLYSRLVGSTIVPANSEAVLGTVDFGVAGAGHIDIPVVSISGVFRLDGQAFPQSIYENAKLWLVNGDDRVLLGQSRHRSYSAKVIAGTYDVAYERLIGETIVPSNAWAIVEKARPIQPSWFVRKVDIDVASGWLETAVSYWGGPHFASIYERGLVSARTDDEDTLLAVDTRYGSDSVRVVAGAYELRYDHQIGSAMPQNHDAEVGTAVVEPGGTALVEVDLRPGTLTGTYSHGGQAFPPWFHIYANMALVDRTTGERIELAPTNQGGFSARLLPGTYEVVYDHHFGTSLPENRGARIGCIAFAPNAP